MLTRCVSSSSSAVDVSAWDVDAVGGWLKLNGFEALIASFRGTSPLSLNCGVLSRL